MSNQHIFNESEDGTEKNIKSMLTAVGAGGIGSVVSVHILKIPFENLTVISVVIVVIPLIICCFAFLVINSNRRTRNSKELMATWLRKGNNYTKPRNKASPNKRKKSPLIVVKLMQISLIVLLLVNYKADN